MDGLRLKYKEGYRNGWIKVEMEGGLWKWMDEGRNRRRVMGMDR